MIAMAENLKQRFLDLVDDSKADGGECSRSDSKELMIVEKLQEMFPQLHPSELSLKTNHYLLERSATDIDIESAVNEISQDILSTQDFPDGPATSDDQQGPLQYLLHAPEEGKYHDFDDENQNHFNLAASQFYKMLLHKPSFAAKPIENKSNALASVEYVVNPKTLKTFNAKKRFFLEKKRGLRVDGKVKE